MTHPLTDAALHGLLARLASEEEFVFLETSRVTAEEHRSFLFRRPHRWLTCTGADDAGRFLAEAEAALEQGHYLAGWFAYEFGLLLEPALAQRFRPPADARLAELGVFAEPHCFDHRNGSFSGAGPWPTAAATESLPPYGIDSLALSMTEADYLAAIERIKAYIAAGDTYQVNFTLKLLFDFHGSAEALYAALRRNQHVSFGAYLRRGDRRILSLSPELFFRRQGERCTVRPMKGTVGRGVTPAEDRERIAFLKNDVKNRSENVMIVDLLRNDLGRIATMGSVRADSLFDVETYESLHQMTSTVSGRLRPGTGLASLFRALFPCGSVTGAPKIHTMEIIAELESEPRGVYTGAIGMAAPSGDAVFNVPIRTVQLGAGRGEMGIGSGVVYDSDAAAEWEECRLKGRFLTEPRPAFRLIETILWQPQGGFWLLDLHLRRLARSAGYFNFVFDEAAIRARLDRAAAGFAADGPRRLRLTLAKDGTVELAAAPCDPPNLSLEAVPAAPLPRVTISAKRIDSHTPTLFHKTTLRRLYDEERARATADGFFEVLFLNERGECCEGAISNLFVRQQGRLLTPPVACGLLPGVFREQLLEAGPLPVVEAVLFPADLEHAEAIYIGNSVRGLVRVTL